MENNLGVEAVEDEAATWLLRRENPNWSSADQAQLDDWLQSSANHRVAFIRLRSVWRETQRLKVASASVPAGQVPERGALVQSPFFRRKYNDWMTSSSAPSPAKPFWPRMLAAGVLLASGLGVAAYFWPAGAPSYRTAVGGLATVPTDDGSKITLNTASEITLQITAKERRVNLLAGEAFFDVAKDPARPFVVYANDQRIIAVGTRFAVRLKPEAVQVAVTEGRVRVEKRAHGGSAAQSPLLTAGTIANAQDEKVSIEQQPLANVEQLLGWRTGNIVLRKVLLGEAVAEFNRYNRRQLIIEDAALADIRVGGNFRSDNLDGFVRLLEEGFQIDAKERSGRIVLVRKHQSPL